MNKGNLIIISGPSGSGKDEVLKRLFKKKSNIGFSISSVTRNMREGEVEGEKYNFISVEKFKSMIDNDEFLEYNEYCGNFYGTPKTPVIKSIENGVDIVLEVDVNGAENIRKNFKDAVSVFIIPPSFAELKRRLVGRGTESAEVIEKRLSEAIGEISRANEYDYIVVNDKIDEAVDNIITIINSERFKYKNQEKILNEVLKNVKPINRKTYQPLRQQI